MMSRDARNASSITPDKVPMNKSITPDKGLEPLATIDRELNVQRP